MRFKGKSWPTNCSVELSYSNKGSALPDDIVQQEALRTIRIDPSASSR